MIEDAALLEGGQALTSDVCIIGAGAAGITLALELADSAKDVLLLESGGYEVEAATQALYGGAVTDERLHSPPDRYRQRRFGGTTTIWGGRCMPFDAIDFEARDYVANSGWPISYEALAPFYPKANAICEAGEFAYTMAQAFPKGRPPLIEGFSSESFSTDTLERFSCPTDFGTRYRRRLERARRVRVLLHANVTALHLNGSAKHVESVTVKTLSGKTMTVRAARFVLAAGGLEVARLLLASRDVQPSGIGNAHDVVGRYYMCHIAGTVGVLSINRPLGSISYGYDISDEGIYCRRRIALKPDAQRRHRLGNFIARFHHPRITDPAHRNPVLSLLYLAKFLIPYEYGKRLHGGHRATLKEWLAHVGNVARSPFDTAEFAWHMLKDRKLAERKFPSIIIKPKANLFSLDFHSEQEPDPLSRVTLGSDTDALGLPRLLIDWRYTMQDLDTVSGAVKLLAEAMRTSGTGTLAYDPDTLELEMTRYGAYGGHHLGTARMGTDWRTSVVDADCRVHGVDNLFIAGSAVFPTSSQANPTLTIVALALRLAKRLLDP